MRILRVGAAASVAALLLSPGGVDASSTTAPSLEDLRKKPTKELKAILKSKGAKCKKCVEKDDYVHRVRDTWHMAPKEARTPDGKVAMSKDVFIKQLKESFKKQVKDAGKQDDDDDEGHATDDDQELPAGMPDFESVWRDFSEKLAKGEIEKDGGGNLMYSVADHLGGGGFWGWFERYKMHGLIALNLGFLWFSQRMRAAERERKKAAKEEAAKESSEPAGPKIVELDEDDDVGAAVAVPGEELPKDKDA
mmetsp:Transcript_67185/g.119601  ORF Transcript_67185/g.119601 Transcript_67185/m.119601 type:complete len:250 (-) Transcript_67185:36-785(-)